MYMQNLPNVSHFAQSTFDGGACRTENCIPKRRKLTFCVDEYCTLFYSAVLNH
jgi:hypothetical protein